TREAMKARERDRVGALRMLASALQQDAKLGEDDELAVLRRERKKRLEAAEGFRRGGSEDRARAEESEAKLIAGYLPEERSEDAVLRELEDKVGCEVHLRGNVLTLDGEEGEVRDAAAVVEELVGLIERGHDLAPTTIETVAGAIDAKQRPAEILEDVIWRHR